MLNSSDGFRNVIFHILLRLFRLSNFTTHTLNLEFCMTEKFQDVLDYLVKYAEGLPIKFNHKVTRVTREEEKWRVCFSISKKNSKSLILG